MSDIEVGSDESADTPDTLLLVRSTTCTTSTTNTSTANSEDETSNNSSREKTFDVFEIFFKVEPGRHSLQKAFKHYKSKKQKCWRVSQQTDSPPQDLLLNPRSTEESMMRLRLLFLDQARKYIGVPYAKKYWKPEDPEYSSSLFLDCCGLVRRVLLDLRREFGFCIGPWNQAYQFDTLPNIVDSLDQAKPGDLIFTSATYYKTKATPPKHDLTHVEILLGDGTRSIASRWHKGKVQTFENFQFESTSYHSTHYTIKSIDTWLLGICKSHCGDHQWKWNTNFFRPSEKSIFSNCSDDQNFSDSDEKNGQDQ